MAMTFIAMIAYASRLGLREDRAWIPLLFTVSLGWHLVATPLIIKCYLCTKGNCKFETIGTLIVANLLATLICAWTLNSYSQYAISFLGLTTGILVTQKVFSRSVLQGVLSVASGVVIAICISSVVWGGYYLSPTFEEGLRYRTGNLDELFHIAIANMWNTYGIPSTGLHGTPYLPYHTGSHWALAAVARITGCNIIYSYNICFPIIFASMYVFCMQIAGVAVAKSCSNNRTYLTLLYLTFLPLTLVAGVVKNDFARQAAIWKSSLTSESMCFSVILASCAVVTLVHLTRLTKEETHNRIVRIEICIFMPLIISLTTICKVSVGFILFMLTLFTLITWLSANLSKICLIISIFLTSVSFFLTYYAIRFSVPGDSFFMFHFINEHIAPAFRLFFLPIMLSWSALGIIIWEFANRANTYGADSQTLSANRTFERECLCVVTFFSFFPAIFMKIGGGSAFYFFDFQRQVGCIFIISGVLSIISRKPEAVPSESRRASRHYIKIISPIVFSVCTIVMLSNTFADLRKFGNNLVRGYNWDVPGGLISLSRSLASPANVTHKPYNIERAKIADLLIALGNEPRSVKKSTAIFIPHSNKVFWEFFDGPMHKAVPFLVPGVTGMAMICGLPPESESWNGYGFEVYKANQDTAFYNCDLSRAEAEAIQLGFENLVVIDQYGSECTSRVLSLRKD